jgi:hypothetical protein
MAQRGIMLPRCALYDGRQHNLTDDAERRDALVTRVIITGGPTVVSSEL